MPGMQGFLVRMTNQVSISSPLQLAVVGWKRALCLILVGKGHDYLAMSASEGGEEVRAPRPDVCHPSRERFI